MSLCSGLYMNCVLERIMAKHRLKEIVCVFHLHFAWWSWPPLTSHEARLPSAVTALVCQKYMYIYVAWCRKLACWWADSGYQICCWFRILSALHRLCTWLHSLGGVEKPSSVTLINLLCNTMHGLPIYTLFLHEVSHLLMLKRRMTVFLEKFPRL